ncbi:MAG: class I SAM-dependent methyltransferase [Candidatus Omnitrophica bacterium]|nr:class I SAM-dependent methyltransferase [Candidatus Omnitrophota bacterium]
MKEADIRPKSIFDEYLRLSALDAHAMLEQKADFAEIACPGCDRPQESVWFQKNGFNICRCEMCGSIYCSPRPTDAQLGQFYSSSPSSRFWAQEFFPAVMEARREKLFRPKAQQIYAMMSERCFEPSEVCDVGAGHGLLLEEFARLWTSANMIAVEPGQESATVCRDKGFEVIQAMVEDVREEQGVADLVTCFEVVEHVFDPRRFINALRRLVKPGGYCLVTGLGGDGFDIQVLGEYSKSIFPPHHLNFLSIQGLRLLFTSAGFSDVEITTPGKLDVDIVKNMYMDSKVKIPTFLETLFNREENALKELQEFLVRYQMSSHVWILARY